MATKLSLQLGLRYESVGPVRSNPNAASLRVRLFSEWLDISQLSEVFGEGSGLAWETTERPGTHDLAATQLDEPVTTTTTSATLKVELDVPDLNSAEQRTRLETLNATPGIYAVVLRQETRLASPRGEEGEARQEEIRLVPVSFAYVDCSKFLLESGTVESTGQPLQSTILDVDEQEKAAPGLPLNVEPEPAVKVSLSVACSAPLLSRDTAIALEPLFIDISSLGGYPVHRDETLPDALDSVYVYARLGLGGAISRTIYAKPHTVSSTALAASPDGADGLDLTAASISTEGGMRGADHVSIDCRVCCLPGLGDLSRFKEALKSSTFVVQVHRENISKRCFHARVCDEYHNLLRPQQVGGDAGAAAAAAPAKGAPAKGGGAAPAGSAASFALSQPTGPMTQADQHLLACITRALETAAQIRFHGTGRVRLEQLLEQSVDLLRQFSKRRSGESAREDEDVVVREDTLSEVRLSKPSKPLKWHRPDDISLIGALKRDVLEQQSKMDGTLAATAQSGMLGYTGNATSTAGGSKIKRSSKPRHEQFEDFGTRLVFSAELHRRLSPPQEEPKVFLKVVESFIKDGFTEKTTMGLDDPELMTRLQRRLSITPFTRMVFSFKYDDDDTLLAINEAITKVNKAALKDIQGSIRSYSFSEAELQACVDGSLDVITGFMAIDDETRVVVLEGLAAPGKGMQSVFMDIPKTRPNDTALTILCSPEILFPERLYGDFGPDLKRIRIRDRLRKLARRPELYNRKQVEEVCFSAIDRIMALRRAVDLKSTKELEMYPSAESLNKVELLYGEAISRADLDGTAAEADRAAAIKAKKAAKAAREREEAEYNLKMYGATEMSVAASASTRSNKKTSRTVDPNQTWSDSRKKPFDPNAVRCAPTDCRNDAFEEYLRTRPAHRVDFPAEQRAIKQQAWDNMLARTAQRDAESYDILVKVLGKEAADAGAKIYVYASQSENFKVKAFSELRGRIAKFSDATYTFSKDFISQTICVVDEDADRKKLAAEKRSHWLTQTGFTYPKPKTLVDLITHPKRPSDARVEDLKDPWIGDMGPPGKSGEDNAENLRLERGYSVRVRGGDPFGALRAPEFQREFQLNLVGDQKRLPRGQLVAGMDGDKDPAAFKSVHLGGEGQARIVEEALEKEKADWAAKVVVDDTSFKVGGFTIKEKVFQFERTNDILKDAPVRKELRHLRDRKSVSGKLDYSYSVAPLSLLSSGPFVQNAAADALVRQKQPGKFVTAALVPPDAKPGTLSAKPQDFVRFIDRNANAPRIMCVLHKRPIAPLDYESEVGRSDPKWQPPSSFSSSDAGPAHEG